MSILEGAPPTVLSQWRRTSLHIFPSATVPRPSGIGCWDRETRVSGNRSPRRPSERALGVHGSRRRLGWGLAGWKQRTGVSSGQGSRAQAKFRNQRTLRGALHGVRLVLPGGHQDCRWAFTEGKVGGRVTGAYGKGLNAYRPVTLHQVHIGTSQGSWPNPGCWISFPAGQGCSLGICISIRFPRRSPCCWLWGTQRTLTCWKGELGCLGLRCSEQGEAALPGRAHLAAGLPRMPPLPAVEVQGDGKPSPLLRVGHRPPSDKAKTSCILFSYF